MLGLRAESRLLPGHRVGPVRDPVCTRQRASGAETAKSTNLAPAPL